LPRHLINDSGESFADELAAIEAALGALEGDERERYRNENAAAIATHPASKMLIVAGPGAGKSFLFMDRIKYWLPLNPGDSIYVSSFVRKLCKDLHDEIEANHEVGDEDRQRVTVTTLHTAARSILERNHGTATHQFEPHIKVISSEWESVVWQDVLKFYPKLDGRVYSHKGCVRQLHTEEIDDSEEWVAVRGTYALLSRFYNAVGFADMILLAREALEQSPELNGHRLWIIDEFQDFNRAEEHLIRVIVETARAVVIAGDDEQRRQSHGEDGRVDTAQVRTC